MFTKESEEKRARDTRMSYLSAGVYYFGVVFFLGMVGVVYQMTGLIVCISLAPQPTAMRC